MTTGKQKEKIDFVIMWVDGNDPEWQAERNKYWQLEFHNVNQLKTMASRYRDWDNLRYWFRGVEQFAPWVNKVYFVTWGHVPKWLNTAHTKLEVVRHEEFIPNEYLPVFSANPIELCLYRIPGLSEHFVFFNDDMFLTNTVKQEDFFCNGFPREQAILFPLANNRGNDYLWHMMLTMNGLINDKFDLLKSVKNNYFKWFSPCYGKYLLHNLLMIRFKQVSGLIIPHLPSALRKSVIEEAWKAYEPEMLKTLTHRFRHPLDITHYFYRYWNIMKGEFTPTNFEKYSSCFYLQDNNYDDLYRLIRQRRHKIICINDSTELNDFEIVRDEVICSFDAILPKKSEFEFD